MKFYALNLDDALLEATEFFKCCKDNLKVSVIKEPRKKILGLINSQGIYEIEKIESEAIEDEPVDSVESVVQSNNGYAEIADGIIKVTDPAEDGRYAHIVCDDPNIEVYINDIKVTGVREVSSSDKIELKPLVVEPDIKVRAELSEDKMQAYLEFRRYPGKAYYARDAKPSNFVYIVSDYKTIQPPNPSLESCLAELRTLGVNSKCINMDKINSMINDNDSLRDVVAEGIPPVHGLNSKVVYLFKNDNYRNPDFDTDKKVDLFDHTIIPDVSAGDVLAVKVSPVIPGKDGMTVTGTLLKAKKGIDIPLKAGQGATLVQDKVIATSNGRPSLKYGVITVSPTLVISRDINFETGNVNFEGDVTIKGNVTENLRVIASGDITVYGNVYHATVRARGNVKISGHIINSKVSAGVSMIKYLVIMPIMKQILRITNSMFELMIEMEKLKAIINTKIKMRNKVLQHKKEFDEFFNEIDNNRDLLTDDERKELDSILSNIKATLTGIKAKCIDDFNLIPAIRDVIINYINSINESVTGHTDITFKYSQNSFIQANGSIIVEDKGCFQSSLMAKNTILFKSPLSIVRGGTLIAGKHMKLNSVGTPSGTSTYLKVLDKDGKIEANYLKNTVININGNIQVID